MRACRKALTIILVMSATASAAAEEPRWFADTVGDPSVAVAKWGIKDTNAVGFWVGCEGGAVLVSPELYALDEPARALTIRFTIDGTDYDRPATLTYDDTIKAWHARARIPSDDALIAGMRRGSKLTYDFDPPLRQGDSFTVSLSGSAKAIDEALGGC